MTTICLNMIVRNESKIITRLLESVIDIIDSYCICDTGSTDDTVEVIENYFSLKKERIINGKIVKCEFINFSQSRNFALNACKQYCNSNFILLLDADMILNPCNFDKNMLEKADHFYILQDNGNIYPNIRIIRNSLTLDYKYSESTHECIHWPASSREYTFDISEIFIIDKNDGGCKKDKGERDIRLLLEDIKENPLNCRAHFYLANTYYYMDDCPNAIKYYQIYLKINDGCGEEIWYVYKMLGLCYSKLKVFNNAVYCWMESIEYSPLRLETIYLLVHHYRTKDRAQKIAMQLLNGTICKDMHLLSVQELTDALNDIKISLSKIKPLFLDSSVYDYKLMNEYIILGTYNGIDNIQSLILPIFNHGTEEEIKQMLINIKFYDNKLPKVGKCEYTNKIVSNIKGEDMLFYSSSLSMIKVNDEYLMNVRYVNYYISEDGQYHGTEKNIISLNKFVKLDNSLSPIENKWMNITINLDCLYSGIEDIRLHYIYGNVIYIGNALLSNGKIGVVTGLYDCSSDDMLTSELSQQFTETICEKNWVYIEDKIIYSWCPLRICTIVKNKLKIVYQNDNLPPIFKYARGSSNGFKYKDEYWFVNHIVSPGESKPRYYYHFISVFDLNYNLKRYTTLFTFEDEPIEYCLSIIIEEEEEEEKEKVFMTYSTWDRTCNIGVYSLETIKKMMLHV